MITYLTVSVESLPVVPPRGQPFGGAGARGWSVPADGQVLLLVITSGMPRFQRAAV